MPLPDPFPQVIPLSGPVPAWEIHGTPGADWPSIGTDARGGRLHLACVRPTGAERRTIDASGATLATTLWGPVPGGMEHAVCAPVGDGRILVSRRLIRQPGAWIGEPDRTWRPIALPDPCPALLGWVPLADGGVLLTAERDFVSTQGLEFGPDGALRGQEVWKRDEVTARFRFPEWSVDVHNFDNPWEPGWTAVVRREGAWDLMVGRMPLDAEGHLWFDGWLAVYGEDEVWCVPVLSVQASHRGLYGSGLRWATGLAMDFRGLDLMPGLEEFRARLAAAVPPPYAGFTLVPHSPISVQPLPDGPRKFRCTRLESATVETWTFDGPPGPEGATGRHVVLDGTASPHFPPPASSQSAS